MASAPVDIPITKASGTLDVPSVSSKLSGLHEWLSFENRRVKHWWSARSTEIHKIYASQGHGADELRAQLNEQLRALDGRVDTQCALVAELQDWFRKRAELHQDYSLKLEKLSKSLSARHKEQKTKRENWNLLSVYSCCQILVNQTKKDARDHSAMADVYLTNIIPRFTQVQDDVQRIYKKCRDICYESHEELLKVLHELHTTMRTYHMYQGEFKSAEVKLQNLEAQKSKLEQTNTREKLEKRKKFKVIEKEIEKRRSKYRDARLKALKARNDYILSMDSANASIHKYFVEDLSDIIDCMDFGFHSSIAKALMTHISGQECFKRTLQNGIDDLNKSKTNMDSRHDKQRFLEFNNAAFMLPKKFDFQGHKGDEVSQVLVTYPIQEEMEKRYGRLVSRLTNLKTESEETWKTIETAEKTLLTMINARDYDIAHYFSDEPRNEAKTPEAVVFKRKADHVETEAFYLGKFRDYTLGSNLICRLQARFELIRKSLGDENQVMSSPTPSRNFVNKPRRRRIGRTPLMGQPRLFGGSLEEYLEATGQEIPLIIKSCIRVINLYGLHHQGIFRVSGSQVEINNFRETFEKMEDPLADVSDASDINSIAGVLKLYLRELREPIFPTVYFEQFMEIAQLESKHDFVQKVKEVVMNLQRSVFVVMRYLFAFLNHLSEFSDENMMDPYNLAICFGPTLVPIPEDKDQVQYQNLVNELIKNIIIFYEDIFPLDGGPVYEKYISRESLDLDADMGDAPNDDPDAVDYDPGQSEDDSAFKDPLALQVFGKNEILEAVAQFDFTARSVRELTFNKGDLLLLHSQASSDWWKGSFQGRVGLIPDKYILLKIRDEDKERADKTLSGDEMTKRRVSSSSESVLTSSSHPSEGGGGIGGAITPNGGSPALSTSFSSQPDRNPSPALERQSIGESASPVPSLSSMGSSGAPLGEMEFYSGAGPPPVHSTLAGAAPYRRSPQNSEESNLESSIDALHGLSVDSYNLVSSEDVPYLSTDSVSSLPSSGFHSLSSSSKVKLGETIRMCTSLSESGHTNLGGTVTENWRVKVRPLSQNSLSSFTSVEEKSVVPRLSGGLEGSPSIGRKAGKPTVGAPDLVMDLPVSSLSSSPKSHSILESSAPSSSLHSHDPDSRGGIISGSFSPDDRVSLTAAECFAKQNQSTLKKANIASKSMSIASSTDAQTQTSTSSNVPCSIDLNEEESLHEEPDTSPPVPSVTSIVNNLDNVMLQIKAEQQHQSQAEEVAVEVRAAADMVPSDIVSSSPSTPKLAARYLKAVAASGGAAGVSLKPHVRIKPSVMKKPSLPANLSSTSSCTADKELCSNDSN